VLSGKDRERHIIKLSIKSGKDGIGKPRVWSLRGEEISKHRMKKMYTDLQQGMKLRLGLHECPGPI
jgi:hypothetical protein